MTPRRELIIAIRSAYNNVSSSRRRGLPWFIVSYWQDMASDLQAALARVDMRIK